MPPQVTSAPPQADHAELQREIESQLEKRFAELKTELLQQQLAVQERMFAQLERILSQKC